MRRLLLLCTLSTITIDVTLSVQKENDEIGETLVDLTDECCIAECTVGSFLLDEYVIYAANFIRTSSTPPITVEQMQKIPIIAMLNGSAIKSYIPKGSITEDQLSKVLPDPIVMGSVNMLGSNIRKIIERAFWHYNEETLRDEFIQVSGLSMVIDLNKNSGNRLYYVHVLLGFGELMNDVEYIVVLSKYMWDNMREVYGFDKRLKFNQFDKNLLQVAVEKISSSRLITKIPNGRITFLPRNPKSSAITKRVSEMEDRMRHNESSHVQVVQQGLYPAFKSIKPTVPKSAPTDLQFQVPEYRAPKPNIP